MSHREADTKHPRYGESDDPHPTKAREIGEGETGDTAEFKGQSVGLTTCNSVFIFFFKDQRCPHFKGRFVCMHLFLAGIIDSVLIKEMSAFQSEICS